MGRQGRAGPCTNRGAVPQPPPDRSWVTTEEIREDGGGGAIFVIGLVGLVVMLVMVVGVTWAVL